jgi:hypothetical protein
MGAAAMLVANELPQAERACVSTSPGIDRHCRAAPPAEWRRACAATTTRKRCSSAVSNSPELRCGPACYAVVLNRKKAGAALPQVELC